MAAVTTAYARDTVWEPYAELGSAHLLATPTDADRLASDLHIFTRIMFGYFVFHTAGDESA